VTIVLNHTIVPAHDKAAAARFFADIFGLATDPPMGPFAPVHVNAGLTFDFLDTEAFDSHHYAFRVSEDEFDAILQRVKEAGITYGSGPHTLDDGRINHRHGGRGVYFRDPSGHVLELLTRDPGSTG
jgi:catechol 2,3-dioxygenase-like lactoylglutathione lyase family enzyme